MSDEPTPRELMIRMEALVRQAEADRAAQAQQNSALVNRLDTMATTMATTYVPKGEYLSDRRGDERRFGEIEGDLATQAGWRRQVSAAILVGMILAIFGIVLTLTLNGAGVAGAGQ